MGDSRDRRAAWVAQARQLAAVHATKLAVLASAFDALVEGERMLEEQNAPPDEWVGMLDGSPEELVEGEAEMPVEQAADILRDFFGMSIEGQARLDVLLGLAED